MGTFMFDRNGNIKRIDTRGVETPDGDILEDILIKDKSGVIDGIDIDTTANNASLILDNGTYHITKRPSNFLKYCSIDTILLVIENEI